MKLIVRAVNAHDELVEAAELAYEALSESKGFHQSTTAITLRAALANARGEEDPRRRRIQHVEAEHGTLAGLARFALRYLEHPDVQAIGFALPASAVAKRLRAVLEARGEA